MKSLPCSVLTTAAVITELVCTLTVWLASLALLSSKDLAEGGRVFVAVEASGDISACSSPCKADGAFSFVARKSVAMDSFSPGEMLLGGADRVIAGSQTDTND
jgi:hypothetical protein